MAKITKCKDLMMLLLYAKGAKDKPCEPIVGKTRLMKMVFLFNEEIRRKFNQDKAISDKALPNFTPYDYGPFSDKVYADLEFLVDTGFVAVKYFDNDEQSPEDMPEYQFWQASSGVTEDSGDPTQIEEFYLTEIGKKFVDEELGQFTREQYDLLDKFKARCTGITLKALLRYVYTKYPEMITNSKIKDDILKE